MRINYQQSKRKFGAFVIAVSLFELVGCASSSYRERVDVDSLIINCKNAEKEIEFLKELKNTAQSEKTQAWFDSRFNPFLTNREYKESLARGQVEHDIDSKIFGYNGCPPKSKSSKTK